jgi:soluble lytic murein transglycosylase
MLSKDGGLNVSSFSRVLMTFAVVSALGIVLQVDAAGVGPDQKADALPSDPATLATIKTAIALARKGELAQASDVEESIGDPVARKVVEWAILRSKEVDFQRYVAFIFENPNWPNIGLLRRRAEAALWKERLDPQIVRGVFWQKPAAHRPGQVCAGSRAAVGKRPPKSACSCRQLQKIRLSSGK